MIDPPRAPEGRLLFIDGGAGHALQLDGGQLLLRRGDEPLHSLPLRSVGRVVLRQPRSRTLRALLELVQRGVPVHIQDGNGQTLAGLYAPEPGPDPVVRELIDRVERMGDPASAYARWLDLQRCHVASRILRTAPRGGPGAFERALLRYAARGQNDRFFHEAWNELRALSFAWVDGELARLRLRPLVTVLALRGCALVRDLDTVLAVPLLWSFAAWLREHPHHPPRERMAFLESRRALLDVALARALAALQYHLNPPVPGSHVAAMTRRRSGPQRRALRREVLKLFEDQP